MTLISLARSATLEGILILIGLLPSTSWAAEAIAAILYPDLREPFREVITAIIDGIISELLGSEAYAVNDGFAHEALKKTLRANTVGVLLALGRGGFNAAQELGLDLPVVVGALLLSPDENSPDLLGISFVV